MQKEYDDATNYEKLIYTTIKENFSEYAENGYIVIKYPPSGGDNLAHTLRKLQARNFLNFHHNIKSFMIELTLLGMDRIKNHSEWY